MKEHDESTSAGAPAQKYSVPIPPDFPAGAGQGDLSIVDSLIVALLQERACLSDPIWGPIARARIEDVRRALIWFGDASDLRDVRRELLVWALDKSEPIPLIEDATKTHRESDDWRFQPRVDFVRVILGEALPNARIPTEILRDAVRLWPERRRKEGREDAVRALARVLDCDAKSLMVMLRQARGRLRDQRDGTT